MNNNPPSGSAPEIPPDADGAQVTATSSSHSGATTLSETTVLGSENYASITGGENALLVSGGEVTIDAIVATKSGDEASEESDFYGTNAAILAKNGTININGGSVTTNGAHANAVFAYTSGTINIKDTTIKTSGDNSGGIMVTGGGVITATNLTVETSGNSSAAIRSDRGGGAITVSGGYYTTSGQGSPAVYSTANISVSNAELASTASEGVVIEGSNSVTLNNTTLTDTNNTLNGNSETYKNIFIYQSMSGDAEVGKGALSATDSQITTNQGDTFFVTNTTADIQLSNNRIINNDATSAFLRAQAGKWGTAGSNGGHVNLTLKNQVAEGDIVLDSVSSMNLVLNESSFYMGAVNSSNAAQAVNISIDATSQLILAGDSYVTSLTNADTTNQNIYANGHKLYVAGQEVAINGSEAPAVPEVKKSDEEWKKATENTDSDSTLCLDEGGCGNTNYTPYIVGGVALLVIVGAIIAMAIHNKKKKGPSLPPSDSGMGMSSGVPMNGGRPDFSAFDDTPAQPSAPAAPSAPGTPAEPPAQPANPAAPEASQNPFHENNPFS